ncbi:MAG: hypothetical protein V3S44_09105 [Alphaproteobacteria bacterium]
MKKNRKQSIRTMLLVGGVVAASLALGACRENEQGRPLSYDKGKYAGKPDTEISAAARRGIRDRVRHQGALTASPGGGAGLPGPSSSADVRPPAGAVKQR